MSNTRQCTLLLLVLILFPALLSAQSQPTSLVIGPDSIYQGQCYNFWAGDAAWMTLDVLYSYNNGPDQIAWAWPSLDWAGYALICTGSETALGEYRFKMIRNTLRTDWVDVDDDVITVTSGPAQPTSLSITPDVITQGQTYTMTVGDGAYMTLDVQYTLNGGPETTIWSWPNLDGNGQAQIFADSCTVPGTYVFTKIRNTEASLWVDVKDVPIAINAAKQTVTSLAPIAGLPGANVNVTINGSNLCGASLSTTWPGLKFTNISSSNTWVTATFTIESTAPAGWAGVTLSRYGVQTTFQFAIGSKTPPAVTSIQPASVMRGVTVPVTLTGTNLVGAVLSTNWSGVTFSNFFGSDDGLTATASMTVSPTAALGSTTFQVSTPAGSTFTPLVNILAGPVLTREYIYLGGRLVAVKPPGSE
ncbi:MAG: hypothetical protein HY646_03015 [Acidobacteria bacterium]|nr:hypothetical protein [Acidobacteriota bacterium]